MTVEEVRARVAAVKAQAGDDERAHAMEDELHVDVLRAIADGCEDAAAIAKSALVTKSIKFCRWCA